MFAVPIRGVTLRDWLAWYHLLAGVVGMLTALVVAPSLVEQLPAEHRVQTQLLLLSMAALFAAVAAVGVALFSRVRVAPRLAVVCQAVQVPVIIVRSWQWMFFGGAYAVPYWQRGVGISGAAGLKASLQLSWGGAEAPMLFGVNVAPLLIVWLLLRKLPSNEAPPPTSAPSVAVDRLDNHPIEQVGEPLGE